MKTYMVYEFYMKSYEAMKESTISIVEASSYDEAIDLYIEEVGIFDKNFLSYIYNEHPKQKDSLKKYILGDREIVFDEEKGLNAKDISHSIALDTFEELLGFFEDDSLFEKYWQVVEQCLKDSDNSLTSYRKGFNKELLIFICKYLWNPVIAKEIQIVKKAG